MPNVLFDALCGATDKLDDIFFILPGRSSWTRRDLFEHASRLANTLVSFGVEPGDRVAVQVEKSPEAIALYLGCLQCGAVFLPLNTAYTPSEIEYFVTDAEPAVLVCDPAVAPQLTKAVSAITEAITQPIVLTLDATGAGTLTHQHETRSTTFATVQARADDLAAILYTSGTTGRSKGAMLSHGNLFSNAMVLCRLWEFTQDDVLLHALPVYHTHGLFTAINTLLLASGSIIFLPRFNADQMIEQLPQATSMMGVPTFYTRLLDDGRFDRTLVEHMRLFISGSAPLLAETHVLFEQRTGKRILERYGMTETSMNTSNPYQGERRAGTVGFPLTGVELRIRDAASKQAVALGEIGVIEVRGPNVFCGYWRQPEKTSEEMTEDGFFITGDLGLIDSDGYVHIVGRNKDLIICGGFNVYPKEIELILDEQAGVLESAVIGVAHSDFGEAVVAVVVPQPGQSPDEQTIMASVAQSLAKFKHPKQLLFVDELPRNTMGKVQKNQLRETYKDTFSHS